MSIGSSTYVQYVYIIHGIKDLGEIYNPMTDRPNKYTCTKLLVTSFTLLIFVGKNCFCQYLMPKTLYESMNIVCIREGQGYFYFQ